MIDTSKGPATITVTVHVTDDLSGVESVALFFRRPGTTQRAQVEFHSHGMAWSELVAGDALDGHHRATMTLPQYSAYGEWEMWLVVMVDNVGNRVDLWKPEPDGEQIVTESTWPSIFNGFTFAVGTADNDVPPPVQRAAVYLPLLR